MRRLALFIALAVAMLGGAATAAHAQSQPRKPAEAPPDAELLLQLDLLRATDLARQRELYPKMSILERMRLLEQLGWLEWETDATPARKGGSKR